MREVDEELLQIANGCACSAITVRLKIKHANAALRLFAARTFQKGDIVGCYFGRQEY